MPVTVPLFLGSMVEISLKVGALYDKLATSTVSFIICCSSVNNINFLFIANSVVSNCFSPSGDVTKFA